MGEKPNELSGKEWLQNSFSIWRDIEKSKDEKKLGHPAMFPSQLTDKLIKTFSRKKDVVLDPFMGSGSTIISALLLGRKGIGIELSKDYVLLAKKRIKEVQLQLTQTKNELIAPEIHNEDISKINSIVPDDSVDLVITSPPYWDILTEKRSADMKEIRKYSESEKDLGNIHDYQIFLNKLKESFSGVRKVIKKGKYLTMIIMDIRKKSKFYPFHMDIVNFMNEVGFELDDIIIWDRQKEYNNMRPLGYPYVFRVNKVHEYILIFKKL